MIFIWIFLEVVYFDIGVKEGGIIGYSFLDRWYLVSCLLLLFGIGIVNVM